MHTNYVCTKDLCNGCYACVDICKHDAIIIKDEITAYNAEIITEKCVGCGLCKRVCPNHLNAKKRDTIFSKQGWSSFDEERANSSSGGVAAAITRLFINSGGYVCSCLFSNGKFGFEITNDLEIAKRFRGSKYVKSTPMGIYIQVKQILSEGHKVLFIGLPCQVAGILNYTKNNENLYTIDLVCHGTPSPQLLDNYLKTDLHMCMEDIEDLQFREKHTFRLKTGKSYLIPRNLVDRYTKTFLQGLTYTENCYSCQFATEKRISDITIGDSWASDMDEGEQKKGISIILCQTEKGKKLVRSANLILHEMNLEVERNKNLQLRKPSDKHKKRGRFMKAFSRTKSFEKATFMCFPIFYLKQDVKKVLMRIKLNKK
ncbi:Coenzyme F420 hydrogenase/dehydrogenase, beta subunit C-terminal domain [uncultured Eubacterium sp.]|uniref:Coenzyme F420 hydrogenase/dehydrogenase, beta subunit C-terminal domain n=1 Tax=uncultured Eubacterium sp. TaxID=165185 RepID=UPI003265E9A7